jgi:serine/threonine-protein kinase
MNGMPGNHMDPTTSAGSLASWYAPGHSDGFGDRLLMFDNTGSEALELLRFRPELANIPGFEHALRERVRDLRSFNHPSFAPARAVEHLDEGERLALVSVHAPGQRLSELFDKRPRKALHPRIVTWLLRELTPALAALHAEGPDVAHGALTPHRIVLTPEGRLRVVEHVLGSALRQLQLAPSHLWRDFRLVAPPPNVALAPLDARADVIQLAGVALSMLLARPITLDDYRYRLPALLDEFSELSRSAVQHGPPLRLWLERALQLTDESYRSAAEAEQDLKELPAASRSSTVTVPAVPASRQPVIVARPALRPQQRADDVDIAEMFPEESRPPQPQPRSVPSVVTREARETRERTRESKPLPRTGRRLGVSGTALAAGVGAVALVEAAVIALLLTGTIGSTTAVVIESPRPGDTVLVNGAPAGATPLELELDSKVRSVRVVAADVASTSRPAADSRASVGTSGEPRVDPVTHAAARQTSGGVALLSAIPLTVLDGDRVLGTSERGPVVATAGVHQLMLVNEEFGYRATLPITFRQGEIRQVPVDLPTGRLNVNCQPWCNVFIGGRLVGETPLANIELPIGSHDVVLRHPQHGERTETVRVRADAVARLAVALQ